MCNLIDYITYFRNQKLTTVVSNPRSTGCILYIVEERINWPSAVIFWRYISLSVLERSALTHPDHGRSFRGSVATCPSVIMFDLKFFSTRLCSWSSSRSSVSACAESDSAAASGISLSVSNDVWITACVCWDGSAPHLHASNVEILIAWMLHPSDTVTCSWIRWFKALTL